ncbi:patched family protein [Dictyocaulus viviparus]|uniref:Patched family protein n=1 Tax=Dictyocaulus viviparus TaxID=29172 RepID=A0A0D8XDR4_DICVI|nr:patched family protein [Dictyocaulus viviparus]
MHNTIRANSGNENDITGYTPYGARARDELNVAGEFFSRGGNGIVVFVLILPKDGGNALRLDVLRESLKVERILSTNFTIMNPRTNKTESYREFCFSFCQINQPFVQFADAFIVEQSLLKDGFNATEKIQLFYPISTFYNRRLNIQPHFFGVEFSPIAMTNITEENSTAVPVNEQNSKMIYSKMLALQLRAERKDGWTTQMIKDFELSITHYFESEFYSSTIRVLTLSTSYVEAEVVRAGMSLLPFLFVGFAIMACVSTLTTFASAYFMDQFSLAIMACICPFMACGTALGGLFFLGVRFGSILCVTPFLVLAIGVDDAYMMIHSWQRVTKELRMNPVKEDSPSYRLAQVLSETGPAIMISALTNMSADAVGAFTSSPEITLLCYGNAACILVDFIYQIHPSSIEASSKLRREWKDLKEFHPIMLGNAVMVLTGYFEIENERKSSFTQKIKCGTDEYSDGVDKKSIRSFREKLSINMSTFLDQYVDLVTNKAFNFVISIIWLAYLAISIKGITQMPINLTPKKLFASDSSLQEMDDLRVSFVIPHFTLATLFVNNPGDLSDDSRLKRFGDRGKRDYLRLNSFVAEMESLPGSWGSQSSNYFIRDFIEYSKTMVELDSGNDTILSDDSSYLLNILFKKLDMVQQAKIFRFELSELQRTSRVSSMARISVLESVLEKFFLTTAYYGDDLKKWINRDILLKRWRSVVDRYAPEFNITVYYDDGIYLDLIENMPTDTWQLLENTKTLNGEMSGLATICCMAVVCFVFMFDTFTVVITTGVISSIMTGILGILSLTGTELDPIVMAALIISIGFSVDIPAHVSFHYYTAGAHITSPATARRRLRFCLSSVGFPALQASLSTSLCVLALLLVSIYMSQNYEDRALHPIQSATFIDVFVKTMILCMTLCVIHGLLFIPCLINIADTLLSMIKLHRGSKAYAS